MKIGWLSHAGISLHAFHRALNWDCLSPMTSKCEELERVGNDNKSIEEFFIKWCDCKLADSDFTKDGNEFTKSYYTKYLDEVDKIAVGCVLTKR